MRTLSGVGRGLLALYLGHERLLERPLASLVLERLFQLARQRHLVVEALRRWWDEAQQISGRARQVAMSRRLRSTLLTFQMESGRPETGRITQVGGSNYRTRHFAKVCKAAGLGHRQPKDLRDTFGSQLLTCGVQLGYISHQLGHADVAVTARRYARWCGDHICRSPLVKQPGEVFADFLARLDETTCHQFATSGSGGDL